MQALRLKPANKSFMSNLKNNIKKSKLLSKLLHFIHNSNQINYSAWAANSSNSFPVKFNFGASIYVRRGYEIVEDVDGFDRDRTDAVVVLDEEQRNEVEVERVHLVL